MLNIEKEKYIQMSGASCPIQTLEKSVLTSCRVKMSDAMVGPSCVLSRATTSPVVGLQPPVSWAEHGSGSEAWLSPMWAETAAGHPVLAAATHPSASSHVINCHTNFKWENMWRVIVCNKLWDIFYSYILGDKILAMHHGYKVYRVYAVSAIDGWILDEHLRKIELWHAEIQLMIVLL